MDDVLLVLVSFDILSFSFENLISITDSFFVSLQHLGDDTSLITDIVSGRHPMSKKLENAKKPVIIVGADQLARKDGAAILAALYGYANKLNKDVKRLICF